MKKQELTQMIEERKSQLNGVTGYKKAVGQIIALTESDEFRALDPREEIPLTMIADIYDMVQDGPKYGADSQQFLYDVFQAIKPKVQSALNQRHIYEQAKDGLQELRDYAKELLFDMQEVKSKLNTPEWQGRGAEANEAQMQTFDAAYRDLRDRRERFYKKMERFNGDKALRDMWRVGELQLLAIEDKNLRRELSTILADTRQDMDAIHSIYNGPIRPLRAYLDQNRPGAELRAQNRALQEQLANQEQQIQRMQEAVHEAAKTLGQHIQNHINAHADLLNEQTKQVDKNLEGILKTLDANQDMSNPDYALTARLQKIQTTKEGGNVSLEVGKGGYRERLRSVTAIPFEGFKGRAEQCEKLLGELDGFTQFQNLDLQTQAHIRGQLEQIRAQNDVTWKTMLASEVRAMSSGMIDLMDKSIDAIEHNAGHVYFSDNTKKYETLCSQLKEAQFKFENASESVEALAELQSEINALHAEFAGFWTELSAPSARIEKLMEPMDALNDCVNESMEHLAGVMPSTPELKGKEPQIDQPGPQIDDDPGDGGPSTPSMGR